MKATILFCLVSSILIGCSKNELTFQKGFGTGNHQVSFPRDLSNPEVYTITCKGYENHGNECLHRIERMVDGEIFYPELLDFVKTSFSTESFGIQAVEYAVSGESYYLLYDLIINNHMNETVMFVSLVNEKNEHLTYRINCMGSFTSPAETCRERFIFNPSSAQCTCASDNCQVEVIKLGSSQSLTADPSSLRSSGQAADHFIPPSAPSSPQSPPAAPSWHLRRSHNQQLQR